MALRRIDTTTLLRPPAPPGVAQSPVGRPPAGPAAPRFTRPPVSGGGDDTTDLPRPPRVGYLGPPVREGGPPVKGGRGGGLIGPGPTPVDRGGGLIGPGPTPVDSRGGGYLGPPIPADKPRFTRPPIPGPDEWDRNPRRMPPEEPPDWTPWDNAGGGSKPVNPPVLIGPGPTPASGKVNGGNLPRNPGDNDMPPGREQSFTGRSEGWAGGGANAAASAETPQQRAARTAEATKRFGATSLRPGAPSYEVDPDGPNYNPITGRWT